ncbi:MAG: rRNA pseudouridine synthase [Rhodospirillales bacterium]|nr:rRNA pseudouridine synthase [Rhodospirillales bacterium]
MQTEREPPDAPGKGERIAKVIARAGLCSRREAERWIGEGRVAVGGSVITVPSFCVGTKDAITVDGRPLPAAQSARLWRYHKAPGVLTTHRDPQGRPTVFDRLPEALGRVIAVGRLDMASEGLLLLTNDGALARWMALPATGWLRRYRVRAFGEVDDGALARLGAGIRLNGLNYGPIEARIDGRKGSNVWLNVALREGKNREVRVVLAHLGLQVNRLIRVSYGPFQLGNLPRGEVASIAQKVLLEQVGRRGQR